MPSASRSRKRDILTYVAASEFIMYGFKTFDISTVAGITAADTTALGHVAGEGLTPVANKVYVLRANAPKPPRVSKKTGAATGTGTGGTGVVPLSVTTFCAYDRLSAATGAKWTLAKQGRGITFRGEAGPGRQRTAAIPLGGGFYCFSCDRATFTNYGTTLGLKGTLTDAEAKKAFMGSSGPKPGRATAKTSNGSVSSFYDPAKKGDLTSDATGWSLTEAILLMPDATATP